MSTTKQSTSETAKAAGKRLCHAADLGTVPYREALDLQKREVERLKAGNGHDVIFLLEHPHVITTGRNASSDALTADRETIERLGVEIVASDRGGDVTYHGPGQLVGYPVMALETPRRGVRRYVHGLEEVLIRAMADFGIQAGRHPVHRGVWTRGRKIASLGIRISRWITCHGFALNVSTDLSYFSLMNPCGIDGCEMTSMSRELERAGNSRGERTGRPEMALVKLAVTSHFSDVFERQIEHDCSFGLMKG